MTALFDKNTYQTPQFVFDYMNRKYRFDWDGCASSENALCKKFISKELDITKPETQALIEKGARVWINPPYSNPLPFVEAAVSLMTERDCTVVMLLPADKSTKWFTTALCYATDVIDIVGGRINFINPVKGEEVKGNNKGSMFVVFDPNDQSQVQKTVTLDFMKMRAA